MHDIINHMSDTPIYVCVRSGGSLNLPCGNSSYAWLYFCQPIQGHLVHKYVHSFSKLEFNIFFCIWIYVYIWIKLNFKFHNEKDLYKDKDNVACKAMCGFPEILRIEIVFSSRAKNRYTYYPLQYKWIPFQKQSQICLLPR